MAFTLIELLSILHQSNGFSYPVNFGLFGLGGINPIDKCLFLTVTVGFKLFQRSIFVLHA